MSCLKVLPATLCLWGFLALRVVFAADTYAPATQSLFIPSVQVGLATYADVQLSLVGGFQVLNATEVQNAAPPPSSVATTDVYDAADGLLTIPLVSVGSVTYQNVEIRLAGRPKVLSVGGCTGRCTSATPANAVPLVVDFGPMYRGQFLTGNSAVNNIAYTNITLCIPGTETCQNFDHIQVDTGSSGVRVMASVLMPGLNLQPVTSGGQQVFECLQYVSSYNWGSVRMADVKIGGEIVRNIPIQIIGDSTTIPLTCSSSGGAPTNDIPSFGANGIIGIGNFVYDCGMTCTQVSTISGGGGYYTCVAGLCQQAGLPLNQQVVNPVAFFTSQDTDGTVITFPALPPDGAASLAGSLTFGIDTASNNGLGSAFIFSVDPSSGYLTTYYEGQYLSYSFTDSGSSALFFNTSNIAICASDGTSYCPAQPVTVQATNTGQNGVSGPVSSTVANADILYGSTTLSAFNLGISTTSGNSFDWGLPFFFGRSVFTAIEGRQAGPIAGPYVAY